MINCNGFKEFFRIVKLHMAHMDKDGFVRHLAGLDRYMSVDESMSSETIGCFFEIFECSKFECFYIC
jgi:hypothetical protein